MLPKNSLWITIFALSAFSFLSACPSEKTETGEEETDADADGDSDADADSDADSDSDSDADADADADADSDADADGPTCEDVQTGVVAVDETVTLDGLIVTSPVSSAPPGFFVQDAGGGPNHCLFVYLEPGKASINTGDIVSVTGLVADYYDLIEIKVTDLADVTVTGTGTPTVDTLAATPGDWEPYESCLLELEGITILKAADYGEATTSWGINVDDLFFPWKGTPGTAYSSITGPLFYSYETFKIEPRGNSDLAL